MSKGCVTCRGELRARKAKLVVFFQLPCSCPCPCLNITKVLLQCIVLLVIIFFRTAGGFQELGMLVIVAMVGNIAFVLLHVHVIIILIF